MWIIIGIILFFLPAPLGFVLSLIAGFFNPLMWVITLLKGIVLAITLYQINDTTSKNQEKQSSIDETKLIKEAISIIDSSCSDVVHYWFIEECQISETAYNSFFKLSQVNNKFIFKKGRFLNKIVFMNKCMGYIFLVTMFEPRTKGDNSSVFVEYVCMEEEYDESMFYTFCKRDCEEYLEQIPKEIISQVDGCIYDWGGTNLNETVVKIPSIYYEPIYEITRVNDKLVREHEEEYAVVFVRDFLENVTLVTIYEPDERHTLTKMRVKYLCNRDNYDGDLIAIDYY